MFIAQWGIQHWAEEAKKHESYAASFGGDLSFYTAVGNDPLFPMHPLRLQHLNRSTVFHNT